MKKRGIISLISVAALVLMIVFSFVSCSLDSSPSAFELAFDYSAVSGISLIKGENGEVYNKWGYSFLNFVKKLNFVENKPQNSIEVIEKVGKRNSKSYIPSGEEKEILLSNLEIARNTVSGEVVRGELIASDRMGYEFHYTVKAANPSGGTDEYSFYYNSGEERRVNGERISVLEGIVIFEGVEYAVRGEREREGGEAEYKFAVSLGANDYVIMEHEGTAGEREFEYTLYKSGERVYSSSVEYEKELFGREEISISVEAGGIEREYSYEFFEKDGVKYVLIETEEGGIERFWCAKLDAFGAEFVDPAPFMDLDDKYGG